jgi:hypothetical protein
VTQALNATITLFLVMRQENTTPPAEEPIGWTGANNNGGAAT